jgi:hypothetical protein
MASHPRRQYSSQSQFCLFIGSSFTMVLVCTDNEYYM